MNGKQIVERMMAEAKKRRARALALQKSGKTLQEIGDKMGISRQRAQILVAKARVEAAG